MIKNAHENAHETIKLLVCKGFAVIIQGSNPSFRAKGRVAECKIILWRALSISCRLLTGKTEQK